MFVKTYEDVMAMVHGKIYHVINPNDDTVVACRFRSNDHDYWLIPLQGDSSGLRKNTMGRLARNIVEKRFGIVGYN